VVNEHCRQTWKKLRAACLTLLELEGTIREAQGYERLNIASKVCTCITAILKGQLISKCIFRVFNSPKKRPKTIRVEVPQ
jgi:hypothetical protein